MAIFKLDNRGEIRAAGGSGDGGEIMICPDCGAKCDREEVDVEICSIIGPWHCSRCGWTKKPEEEIQAMLDNIDLTTEES
jgi:rubredoxin